MYLKEIRTYGFKSFADKTIIEFGKNINGIVGPNGSGKSNIVDAVRWVLGEQSMKSLRGDVSTDVIFSGSASRKPLNSASVSLIFNNEDRKLPIDFNEVSIKRMAFRTGENEYYINNERVRLKDVNDLLTDSGSSKESFNIISQGKIEEILSNKAEDRRVIFEEASSVLKYKRRKEEALRKLDKTNLNLNRVNDIILELDSSLKPLEMESIKAKEYKNIKDKLSNIEIALIAKNISDLNFEYQNSKERAETIENEISELSLNSSNYDVDILKYKEKIREIREKLNDYQSELISLTKKEEKLSSDIKLLQERNKYKSENGKITNNIINLKEDVLNIDNYLVSLKNNITVWEKRKESSEEKLSDDMARYNHLFSKKNDLNNLLIKNGREETDLKYKIDYLENSLTNNLSLPKSVKSILDNPKYSGVHGVISSLMEVESEYSTSISTALSSASFYLVVDTPDDAKELIHYLKNNSLGRATFYPISSISSRYIDSGTIGILKKADGYIGVASDLVKYDSKYKNIIENVLGNVIVAKDIETADEISRIVNKKYRIVTLDGQVVNVGGSLTGGTSVKVNNSISIKYEIEMLSKKYDLTLGKDKEINLELSSLDKEINMLNEAILKSKNAKLECDSRIENIKLNLNAKLVEKENKEKELRDLLNITNDSSEEDDFINSLYEVRNKISEVKKNISILKIDEDSFNKSVNEIEEEARNSNSYLSKKEKELNALNISINRIDVKLDNLLENLTNDYNMTYDFAIQNYRLDLEASDAFKEVTKLKEKLNMIGSVNLGAPLEYERVKERYDFLTGQKDDLIKAEDTLYTIIKEMDTIMKSKFIETFEKIRKEFKIVYRELFRGGRADLVLTDPDNILETGIEIVAEPPGKKLQSISLLSGGEKTFTAISLLFAILNVRPVPFCLLDEVEAALDDANVESFGRYLDKYRDKTQFILITHKKKTMEYADILYGITMQESGVSKLVSVKLEDIEK